MRPKQYRRHSAEFKIRLVQEFLEGAGSLRSISQEHGISNTLLQVWVDKFQRLLTGDRVDEEKRRDQDAMIAALERKVGRLVMQIDVLKKLQPGVLKSAGPPCVISGPAASLSVKDAGS